MNFAYAAHIGASYMISEGINLDLGYSFIDLGKGKKLQDPVHKNIVDVKALRSNNIVVCVRFKL
jgi:opacity protein-like surface antigen